MESLHPQIALTAPSVDPLPMAMVCGPCDEQDEVAGDPSIPDGLKTTDGQYPHCWSTGYNGDGKPLFECNVKGVRWLPQQNGGVWRTDGCFNNKRKRLVSNPTDNGGSVDAAFEEAVRKKRDSAPREEAEVRFDPVTGVTVSHCSKNCCTQGRWLCATWFAPDPHNNMFVQFEEFMRPYYVAMEPKSTQEARNEALRVLDSLRMKMCFVCRANEKRSRKEGTGKEAAFYQMALKIREHLKSRKCENCKEPGSKVPLECDHEKNPKTADILDVKAWANSGKTPQDMWNEYINHTKPRCKCCHLLQPTHSKQVAARDRERDNPRAVEKNALNCLWKRERGECFYCKRLVLPGQEGSFHWMHSKKRMIEDRAAAGLPPLKRAFSIGSSMASKGETVKAWEKRTKLEVAKCEVGCANCHEEYDTKRDRNALKNLLMDFIAEEAYKRARRSASGGA